MWCYCCCCYGCYCCRCSKELLLLGIGSWDQCQAQWSCTKKKETNFRCQTKTTSKSSCGQYFSRLLFTNGDLSDDNRTTGSLSRVREKEKERKLWLNWLTPTSITYSCHAGRRTLSTTHSLHPYIVSLCLVVRVLLLQTLWIRPLWLNTLINLLNEIVGLIKKNLMMLIFTDYLYTLFTINIVV